MHSWIRSLKWTSKLFILMDEWWNQFNEFDRAPDERFNVFKQQATMIARKKEAAAEQLGKLMEEQTKLAQLVEKKKANAALNAKVRLHVHSQYSS